MFDAAWLNVGSLVFGLVAWIIPIVNLLGDKALKDTRRLVLTISSFSACCIALCLQMFYSYHLLKIDDWSALMDTAGAVIFASIILIVVTIILNTYSMVFRDRKVLN